MDVAKLTVDCRNLHGEGAVWDADAGRLLWTDIEGRALWWHEPGGSRSGSLLMPERLCCFTPRKAGGLLVGFASGFAVLDLANMNVDWIARFEPDNTETRLNDGRTDRFGNFVAGGMNEVSNGFDSSVVRLSASGQLETLVDGVSCANSICFSPDGKTMYFADSPRRQILAYPYDRQTAPLGAPAVLADLRGEKGVPDGSCVDEEGGVWNAEWEGGRVVRVNVEGVIDRIVTVPVGKPTCCAFGGAKLDTLFITTSRLGERSQSILDNPLQGSLFAMKPGVRGVLDTPYLG